MKALKPDTGSFWPGLQALLRPLPPLAAIALLTLTPPLLPPGTPDTPRPPQGRPPPRPRPPIPPASPKAVDVVDVKPPTADPCLRLPSGTSNPCDHRGPPPTLTQAWPSTASRASARRTASSSPPTRAARGSQSSRLDMTHPCQLTRASRALPVPSGRRRTTRAKAGPGQGSCGCTTWTAGRGSS